jgi:hypothetical protein
MGSLTPFVSPQLNLHELAYIGFVVFEFPLRFQSLGGSHSVMKLR